jgi:hypothetical protein
MSGSSVPTFRDNLSGPSSKVLDFLTLEDEKQLDRLGSVLYDVHCV